MITFKDIKNKKTQIKEEKAKYKELIKNSINEFIKIYISSLQLPAETFTFKDGRQHPYVFILNKDLMPTTSLSLDDLHIDKVNGASFILHTAVDDEAPFPSPVQISISVYFIDGKLEYLLQTGHVNNDVSLLVNNESDLRTFCEIVKESIIARIESEQIGKKTLKDDSVNIWN